MKIFTITLTVILFSITLNAQNGPIDFEPDGFGADWTWTVFENDENPPLEIIENPDKSGINTSDFVAQFTATQDGQPFAGVESLRGGPDLGPFVLDATNSTIRIMVWKSVISDVGIKLASPTGWSQGEIKVANTKVNEWEELTFDFSGFINPPDAEGQLDHIVVFPDFNDRGQDNVVFFDNITFGEPDGGGDEDEPATAAPTPQEDPSSVISLFSDAYDNVPVDTWRTDWSAGNLQDIEINGNPTKLYTNVDFIGIETVANQIDITGMTNFRIDIWSPNHTFFGVKLVDFGPSGEFGGGDDTEHQIDFVDVAQGEWISIDIPLSEFEGLMNRENIAQFILVGQPTGETTLYVDNVYFYDATSVNTNIVDLEEDMIELFPNPVLSGSEVNLSESVKEMTIVDFSGRVIDRALNTSIIQTNRLRPGAYFLQVITDDNKRQVLKLLVQ